MNYRTVVLHAEENLGTSGTKTIDINVKDPISSLHFIFKQTMVDANRIAPEPHTISKLEIVDGSDVLLSLTGEQVVALAFYEGHEDIAFMASNLRSMDIGFHLHVYFGRYFLDPLLALDPSKHRNPQIKITFNCANIQVGSTPLYASILAECFDEKVISPLGFLRQTEHNSYTGAASTYVYVDLPTDLPIRKLYLQQRGYYSGVAANLTDVKLSEDNDKRIPFSLDDDQWKHLITERFGNIKQVIYSLATDTRYTYCCATEDMLTAIANNTSESRPVRSAIQVGGVFICISSTPGDMANGHMEGILPYGVLCYPFGLQQEIDDWYDVTKVGSLRWRVQSGTNGASCTFHTILQQLRRY